MKKLFLSLIAGALAASGFYAEAARVYIGTKKADGIFTAELDTATGRLSTPVLAGKVEGAGFITISPDSQYLFAAGVSSFKVNADGSLTKRSEQRTGEQNSLFVSTDASGRLLMTAYYGSGSIGAFKILPGGFLSGTCSLHRFEGSGGHPVRQTLPHAHSIVPNPANTHAYAANFGGDKIMIYQMDLENGALIPAGEALVPGGAMGPRHMKWLGQTLYVLNELDLSVSIFKETAPGKIKLQQTVSMVPEGTDKTDLTGAEIRIHPNGRFIYTSIRDNSKQKRDSICQLKMTDGGLERLGSTFAEVWYPRNFSIDPAGKWLLVGGRRSQDIAVFRIDPETGALAFTGQRIPFGGEPTCFQFLK